MTVNVQQYSDQVGLALRAGQTLKPARVLAQRCLNSQRLIRERFEGVQASVLAQGADSLTSRQAEWELRAALFEARQLVLEFQTTMASIAPELTQYETTVTGLLGDFNPSTTAYPEEDT